MCAEGNILHPVPHVGKLLPKALFLSSLSDEAGTPLCPECNSAGPSAEMLPPQRLSQSPLRFSVGDQEVWSRSTEAFYLSCSLALVYL